MKAAVATSTPQLAYVVRNLQLLWGLGKTSEVHTVENSSEVREILRLLLETPGSPFCWLLRKRNPAPQKRKKGNQWQHKGSNNWCSRRKKGNQCQQEVNKMWILTRIRRTHLLPAGGKASSHFLKGCKSESIAARVETSSMSFDSLTATFQFPLMAACTNRAREGNRKFQS